LAHSRLHSFPTRRSSDLEVAKSPLSLKELQLLKDTVLWTDEDTKYIRMSREVLEDQTDDILDVWYSFVKVSPQLAVFFGNKTDQDRKSTRLNSSHVAISY